MDCQPEMFKCYHCDYYKVIGEYKGKCMKDIYSNCIVDRNKIVEEVMKNLDPKLSIE